MRASSGGSRRLAPERHRSLRLKAEMKRKPEGADSAVCALFGCDQESLKSGLFV
jgi:hypothetical protein